MLDHADLKWIAATATELNRLLQLVSRSADQVRRQKGEGESLEALGEQVEQASKASQALFDRITSRILFGAGGGAMPVEKSPAPRPTPGPAASTTVSVKMPVGEVTVAPGDPGDPLIRNPQGERELILVVDDDLDLLTRVGDMLEFEDYRVILAKDGIEALRIYRQMGKKIALILLDYFLPVMDGDAVFDELKAIDPTVQVVLSSGFGEQAKLGSMLARGLCGFIPKPYTHERLMEQIRSVIEA